MTKIDVVTLKELEAFALKVYGRLDALEKDVIPDEVKKAVSEMVKNGLKVTRYLIEERV